MDSPRTSTAAILSLIFGLGSFCLGLLPAIPAVIAGALSLSRIGKAKDSSPAAGSPLRVLRLDSAVRCFTRCCNVRVPAQGLNRGPGTFGRPSGNGVQILLRDGRVTFLHNNIDPKLLSVLATPSGEEPVDLSAAVGSDF